MRLPRGPAPVHFDRLTYSTFLSDCTDSRPSRVAQALYRRLAAPYAKTPPTREIYVYRGPQGSNRLLLNEDELAARLAAMGIEVVKLERLPVAQQIALFASAKLVVGAHGAGLANIVFCSAGTCVLELTPDSICRQNFAALAVAYDLTFFVEHYPTLDGETRNFALRWNVDVDDVAAQIEAVRRFQRGSPQEA